MSAAVDDRERIVRATLTYLTEPGDPLVVTLLQHLSPGEVLGCIQSGTLPGTAAAAFDAVAAQVALERCRSRTPLAGRGLSTRNPATSTLSGLHGVPASPGSRG